MEDVLTMADMELVFSVTDAMEIDRESIRVELTKEDPGLVRRGDGDLIEIVVPLTVPLRAWLPTLQAELRKYLPK